MLNEPIYRMIVQVSDDQKVTVSEFVRKLVEDRINQGRKNNDIEILLTL